MAKKRGMSTLIRKSTPFLRCRDEVTVSVNPMISHLELGEVHNKGRHVLVKKHVSVTLCDCITKCTSCACKQGGC